MFAIVNSFDPHLIKFTAASLAQNGVQYSSTTCTKPIEHYVQIAVRGLGDVCLTRRYRSLKQNIPESGIPADVQKGREF